MSFSTDPDTPCRATVDRLDMLTGAGEWWWRVHVRTAPFWHRPASKVYFIAAHSDTLAAREGIRRFVEETKQTAPQFITVH